jgi:hypothetical protein
MPLANLACARPCPLSQAVRLCPDLLVISPHFSAYHQAGGFAAVPLNLGKRGAGRQFDPQGRPLCAAGLAMERLMFY